MPLPNANDRARRFAERFPRVHAGLFTLFARFGSGDRPPQLLNFVGGEAYDEIGRGHFENIRDLAGVEPGDRVLDVGCGIGRVARFFAEFLDEGGRYDGFDVVEPGIRWCNAKLRRDRPDFRFAHVDLYNAEYNAKGALEAGSFRFPYEDRSFDVVFATSILTHLLPDAVENYVREMHRVLTPGGRSYVTYFLLDEQAKRHMPESEFPFKPSDSAAWVTVPEKPEMAVAYEEDYIVRLYEAAGLQEAPRVYHGTWSGRLGEIEGQDTIVSLHGGDPAG